MDGGGALGRRRIEEEEGSPQRLQDSPKHTRVDYSSPANDTHRDLLVRLESERERKKLRDGTYKGTTRRLNSVESTRM